MSKIIACDTRQQMHKKHHEAKEKYFTEHGFELIRTKLPYGDYAIMPNLSVTVDTKQSISELYADLIQDHDRFHNECVLAQKCGGRLIILVENKDGIKDVQGVANWKNPQMFRYYKAKRNAEAYGLKPPKPPASNVQLIKIMSSMTRDYGVEFLFCTTAEAGEKVISLLGGKEVTE